jgi:hypothetical protein
LPTVAMKVSSAPVRKYLPKLIDLVFNGTINPGKVFDLVLDQDAAATVIAEPGRYGDLT